MQCKLSLIISKGYDIPQGEIPPFPTWYDFCYFLRLDSTIGKNRKNLSISGGRRMAWFWLFVLFLSLIWMVVTNAQYLQ
jgi:hypothetical protein